MRSVSDFHEGAREGLAEKGRERDDVKEVGEQSRQAVGEECPSRGHSVCKGPGQVPFEMKATFIFIQENVT